MQVDLFSVKINGKDPLIEFLCPVILKHDLEKLQKIGKFDPLIEKLYRKREESVKRLNSSHFLE